MTGFSPAIAEIWLGASALVVVLGGVFSPVSRWRGWTLVSVIAVIFSLIVATRHYNGAETAFDNMFIQDNLALAFKYLIGAASVLAMILAVPYLQKRGEGKFEYPLLILLATTGMFGMVSSQDFLALYVSLELQSLSLYVLASFRRDVRLNSEAGLKYFFLGALSSGILLYGISLLYGFVGSTSYLTLFNTFAQQGQIAPGVIVGVVLVLSGFAFKVSAAPFHMWAPDVYQGAPTPVTAFFAMAPKAAAIGVLCRLVIGPLSPIFDQAQQILVILALASMAVGAYAAIAQKNLKRLLAYSSIGHVGFIMLALASGGNSGVEAAIVYLALYIIMTVGAFTLSLAVHDDAEGDEQIAMLSGLAKRQPILAVSFAVILLSMAGIPPLAGFFAKLIVIKAAVAADLTWVAVVGVLLSVVSAYYYIRIIKIMYFDETIATPAVFLPRSWYAVIVSSAVLMIVLLVYPQPIAHLASWAIGAR